MLTEIVNISASFCLDAQAHFQLKGEHKRATFPTNVKCKDRTGSLVVCFLLPCQLNLITILIMLLYSFQMSGGSRFTPGATDWHLQLVDTTNEKWDIKKRKIPKPNRDQKRDRWTRGYWIANLDIEFLYLNFSCWTVIEFLNRSYTSCR